MVQAVSLLVYRKHLVILYIKYVHFKTIELKVDRILVDIRIWIRFCTGFKNCAFWCVNRIWAYLRKETWTILWIYILCLYWLRSNKCLFTIIIEQTIEVTKTYDYDLWSEVDINIIRFTIISWIHCQTTLRYIKNQVIKQSSCTNVCGQ